jgi:hypothetical protein
VLAHHENARRALGQRAQAGFQRGEELLLPQRALGRLPFLRRLAPVAAPVEQFLEVVRIAARLEIRGGPLPVLPADRVDDLVLEDSREPGAQVGAAAETGFAGERREQGLLDGVLGRRRIAQLQRGVAQQVGAQGLDLGTEIGGGRQGGLNPDLVPPF